MAHETPTSSFDTFPASPPTSSGPPQVVWYDYLIRAHPHHTDYAGVAWHGSYINWMEEARIECLRSAGLDYVDLVEAGCELPVVEMSVRYHQPIRMGMEALVRTRMAEIEGVRINWDYQIQSVDGITLFVTARITLVPVDRSKGKIARQFPALLKQALVKLAALTQD
ncbi:MAG: acyl-CoA thioesterase [Leptolyngbyaceae cyanobacterium]